jgi:hypothetical protein
MRNREPIESDAESKKDQYILPAPQPLPHGKAEDGFAKVNDTHEKPNSTRPEIRLAKEKFVDRKTPSAFPAAVFPDVFTGN